MIMTLFRNRKIYYIYMYNHASPFWATIPNLSNWDNNSDAALDTDKVNSNNYYKDKIRTWELKARIMMNKGKS